HYSTIETAPIFFFLLGAGLSLAREESGEKENIKNKFSYILIVLFLAVLYFPLQKFNADYLFMKGLRETESGKAIGYLERAVKKNSHAENYYLVLNGYYVEKGESEKNNLYFQKALDLLIEAARIIPLDYRITYQLGETYLKIANYAENKDYVYMQAAAAYQRTLELYPNFPDAHLKIGVAYAHLSKEEDALKSWNKCFELKKTNAECYYNLSVLYEKRGEKEKAKENYEKYLEVRE
ncbi:MAG: tetratricopeptide repeat protein, partial [bacterium]